MIMPQVSSESTSVDMISQWNGYNHNISVNDGDFYEMKNMSSDRYPLASTRDRRGSCAFPSGYEILAVTGKDKMIIAYKAKQYNGVTVAADSAETLLDSRLDYFNGLYYDDEDTNNVKNNRIYCLKVPFTPSVDISNIPIRAIANLYQKSGNTTTILSSNLINTGSDIHCLENEDIAYISGNNIAAYIAKRLVRYTRNVLMATDNYTRGTYAGGTISQAKGSSLLIQYAKIYYVTGGKIINNDTVTIRCDKYMYQGMKKTSNSTEVDDGVTNEELNLWLVGKKVRLPTAFNYVNDITVISVGQCYTIDNTTLVDLTLNLSEIRKIATSDLAFLTTDGAFDGKNTDMYINIGNTSEAVTYDTTDETKYYKQLSITDEDNIIYDMLHTAALNEDYHIQDANGVDTGKTVNLLGGSLKVLLPCPEIITGQEIYSLSFYNYMNYICSYDPQTQAISNETLIGAATTDKRQLISMGANVILLPDKKIINTLKTENGVFSDIKDCGFDTTLTEFTWFLSDSKGQQTDSNRIYIQTDSPDEYVDAANLNFSSNYWINPQDNPGKLKYYSSNKWTETTAYITIKTTQLSSAIDKDSTLRIIFNKTDNVDLADIISDSTDSEYYTVTNSEKDDTTNIVSITFAVQLAQLAAGTALNGTVTANDGKGTVKISSGMPELDYVIECQNRLWGCRYGTNTAGDTVNEIFASRLGDPTDWNYFQNTSIDSYYVSVGTDGPFTGAASYQSTPVFFKENCIHRISGTYPANYSITTTECYGVKKGCSESIDVMNDIVYYLSPVGMTAYGGGMPVSLAEAFGEVRYSQCISGDAGNKLYCAMTDSGCNRSIFVYDDSKGLWHREDNLQAVSLTTYQSECIAITGSNEIISLGGQYGTKEEQFEFIAQTGDFGYTSPFRKRILRLVLRLQLSISSFARIEIEYDNDGIWRKVSDIRPRGTMSGYAVPISPQRCDHFALRITGKGDIKIQSLTKCWSEGSEED